MFFHEEIKYKLLFILLLFFNHLHVYASDLTHPETISVCYNYSCKNTGQVKLVGAEWEKIESLFKSESQSSQEERNKISQAIALMEQYTGKLLGTSNDQARNDGTGEEGQMDCIDESKNTTTYLHLFNNQGWIRWHQIEQRAKRSPYFFDTHWTAVIKDNTNNQQYAIDSWFRENGKEPVILTLEDWMDKKEEP